MRRALWVVAALAAVSAWGGAARAQAFNSGFSEPFFLYYGWYLPRQAALADQPRVQDTITANVAANQANALTNRSNLYDPNGGYGRFDPHSTYDPFDPKAGAGARGPGAAQFYPSLRVGQGPNRNVSVAGRGVRRGGPLGVPSPGPR